MILMNKSKHEDMHVPCLGVVWCQCIVLDGLMSVVGLLPGNYVNNQNASGLS